MFDTPGYFHRFKIEKEVLSKQKNLSQATRGPTLSFSFWWFLIRLKCSHRAIESQDSLPLKKDTV